MPIIAFQGSLGAYSHVACQHAYPDYDVLPCLSFAAAMEKVQNGEADLAMIPIENSSAGRVTDAHQLLLSTSLHIVGEHFEPVHHCLLAVKGSSLAGIKTVHSHIQALGQCRHSIEKLSIKPQMASDTAGAAQNISKQGDQTKAAIASKLAAEIYDLDILKENFEDFEHNTTRFLVFSNQKEMIPDDEDAIISLIFDVLNQPASLYKALACFAENDVNLVKLESYMDPTFKSATFYVEVSGHPNATNMKNALSHLEKTSKNIRLRGVYKAHSFR